MALTLVPRHLRALSDHINSIIRVLRGTDPDSLWLRLAGGGSFEVRNSATNAAVLRVTDAGATLTGAVSLPAQSITSAMIANGTIVNADLANETIIGGLGGPGISKIAPGTITGTDIANGTIGTQHIAIGQITSNLIADGTIQGADIANATIPSSKLITGVSITPNSITNAEIQDGTVRTEELQANAVSQTYRAAINTGAMASGGPFDVPGSGLLNPVVAAGEACIFNFNGTVTAQTTGAIIAVTYVPFNGTPATFSPGIAVGGLAQAIAISDIVVGTAASGQHKLTYSCNAGTVTLVGRMHVTVLKR